MQIVWIIIFAIYAFAGVMMVRGIIMQIVDWMRSIDEKEKAKKRETIRMGRGGRY